MSTDAPPRTIVYPDSDGLPMSDNTLQFEWITMLVGGLEVLYRNDPNVFVAGDLLWYPIEGDNKTRSAPDAMVVFGRPKGYRGSYMQWVEEGIAPQVVFEVLSPGNRFGDKARKFAFYEQHGVDEYYMIDPDRLTVQGWQREGGELSEIAEMNGWVSPRCGIRFEVSENDLRVLDSAGSPFETYVEVVERAEEQRRQAEEQRRQAEEQRRQAEEQRRQAEEQRRRADRLAEKLRALGADPDEPT